MPSVAFTRVDPIDLREAKAHADQATGDVGKGLAFDGTSKNAKVNASAGGRIIGVLTEPAKAGKSCTYQRSGVARVIVGAQVARGDLLACGSAGKFAVATSGQHIVAVALEGGAGDGSVIAAELGYQGTA